MLPQIVSDISVPAWAGQFEGAITLCNREGIIVYMNEASVRQFQKYGGEKLLGSNLLDCHPEPARSKLVALLESPARNVYSTEKNGVHRLVMQAPWMEQEVCRGLVEISFEIPHPLPHFVR